MRDKSPKKFRLDLLILDYKLASTRQKAQALIMAGQVLVNGQVASKPGTLFPSNSQITLKSVPQYVGRGGFKLAHALDEFSVDPTGLAILDVGSSTGGFTDCLIQHGASCIYAIDAGRGQLHDRLRKDSRVVSMEGINAHYPFTLPSLVSLAVMDVAFISIVKVIPSVVTHLTPDGIIIALIKPQFEARRAEIGRKGVIKDPMVHARVIGRIAKWAVNNGFRIRNLTSSPIRGAEGNQEFFISLQKHESKGHT